MSKQIKKLNESMQYIILRLDEVENMIRKNKNSDKKDTDDDLPFFSEQPSQGLRLDFLELELKKTKRAVLGMSAALFFLCSLSLFLAFYVLAY